MIVVGVLLGLVCASGLLLAVAPWWWPQRAQADRAPSWLRTALHRAGFNAARPSQFVWLSAFFALLGAALTFALTTVPVIALLAGAAAGSAPAMWLSRRAERRRRTLQAVWPDVVDHLLSAIRAGHGLPDALAALGENGPEAIRPDLARFASDYRRSGSWDIALTQLKERLADPTADRLCETLRLAREVGGTELVPVLRAFAGYLREDAATTAELRARQSWITNAARLGVVAPWVVLLLLSLRPEGRAAYNTPTGVMIILVGAALSVIAYQLMRRIARFRPEPRWAAS